MQIPRRGDYQKTVSHGRKLLGAYFKAYFYWKVDGYLSETLKPKICIFRKSQETISKDAPCCADYFLEWRDQVSSLVCKQSKYWSKENYIFGRIHNVKAPKVCPKCLKMASENHQKSKKMWPRLDPGRANGIRDRLWAGGWYNLCLEKTRPDSPGHDLGWPRAPFGNRFRYKNQTKRSKKTLKKWSRKTMEKRWPKVTKMATKWMAKS